MNRGLRQLALTALAAAFVLGGCGDDSSSSDGAAPTPPAPDQTAPAAAPPQPEDSGGFTIASADEAATNARDAGYEVIVDADGPGEVGITTDSGLLVDSGTYETLTDALPEGGEFGRLRRRVGRMVVYAVVGGPDFADPARLWFAADEEPVDVRVVKEVIEAAEQCTFVAPTPVLPECEIALASFDR